MDRTAERHFALVGNSLGHSFSQVYFEAKFKELGLEGYRYSLLELPSVESLRDAVAAHGLAGFNVTMPYKVDVLPLLDGLDDTAADIGAVNTVRVVRDGDGNRRLLGHNTDGPALRDTLRPLLQPWHRQALVLGSGGAARAAAWALRQLGIDFCPVSRQGGRRHVADKKCITYGEAAGLAASHTLIVNATPVGMVPQVDASPWPRPDLLTPRHTCYDMVYNPSPTRLMQEARAHGATATDGLAMLHRQADLAFDLWKNE